MNKYTLKKSLNAIILKLLVRDVDGLNFFSKMFAKKKIGKENFWF